jgi:Uncharacterised protein conserved in bacteria (DUF2336)
LIAKASDDVRKKLEIEQPEAGSAVANVAGFLHAMFGPASKSYFAAKRTVGAQHHLALLGEAEIFEYAQARKLDEAIVALSLLCTLPVDVVERAMLAPDGRCRSTCPGRRPWRCCFLEPPIIGLRRKTWMQ